MNLKQRIIGAIVLIALAVIFLPMLLQESKGPKVKVWTIPNKPSVPQVQEKVSAPAVTLTPSNEQKIVQPAWSLQLGTFAKQANGQSLLNRLRKQGYSAYLLKMNNNNKIFYKVYVGPEIRKQQLQSQAEQIESKFGLKGQLVNYQAIPEQGDKLA